MRILIIFQIIMVLVTIGGCTKAAKQPKMERLKPPDLSDEIRVGVPSDVDLNAILLQNILDSVEADSYQDLNSILVSRNSILVMEAYFNGESRETMHDIRSAGKSVTSTLVGIALHHGALESLDQKVIDFFPEYKPLESPDPRKDQITVRHLLEMRSGINADDDDPASPGNENRMLMSNDWIRFALNVPMSETPGKIWRYAGLNTMLLGDVVQRATNIPLTEYLETKLLQPMGITDYDWKKSPMGRASGQGFLYLRPRDMLKFGILYLKLGKWNDQRLVPLNWIHDATRIHTPLKYRRYSGYGYQWWTARETIGSHQYDFYMASGNGGQKIYVIPEADMVVVTTSAAYNKRRGHARARRILRNVLLSIGK